jgi:hypothetical protein
MIRLPPMWSADGYAEAELLHERWQGKAWRGRLLGAGITAVKAFRAMAAERAAREARRGTGPVWPR